MTILDFCAFCGVLLPEGKGCDEDPRCDNCGNDIRDRKDRAQGVFNDQDAHKLTLLGEDARLKALEGK